MCKARKSKASEYNNDPQQQHVIYTSGTSGKPKGVLQTQQRAAITPLPRIHFDQNDVWTQFHEYTFDFSVWEIWGALLHGLSSLFQAKAVKDTASFAALCAQEKVTVLNLTPGAFYALITAVQSSRADLALRFVIFGGDKLNISQLAPWWNIAPTPNANWSICIITETTVHITLKKLNI